MDNKKELKIEFLKMMNKMICDYGDENLWLNWIEGGVPDEPSDEDYEFIATNDDSWFECCELFIQIFREMIKI